MRKDRQGFTVPFPRVMALSALIVLPYKFRTNGFRLHGLIQCVWRFGGFLCLWDGTIGCKRRRRAINGTCAYIIPTSCPPTEISSIVHSNRGVNEDIGQASAQS